jgi:hypothetical protein
MKQTRPLQTISLDNLPETGLVLGESGKLAKQRSPDMNKIAVIHNIVANARFEMGKLGRRLFYVQTTRLKPGDHFFRAERIHIKEFIDNRSNNNFESVDAMVKKYFDTEITVIDPVSQKSLRLRIVDLCEYDHQAGTVMVKFAEVMKPFMLFANEEEEEVIKAKLQALFRLKSEYSDQIYLWLKSMELKGQQNREMGLDELRRLLNIEKVASYSEWKNIKRDILCRAEVDLQNSDVPFRVEPKTIGRKVYGIDLILLKEVSARPVKAKKGSAKNDSKLVQLVTELPLYLKKLRDEYGIPEDGLLEIQALVNDVEQPEFSVDYVEYNIYKLEQKKKENAAIKSESGYLFCSITKHWHLADYKKALIERRNRAQNKQRQENGQTNIFLKPSQARPVLHNSMYTDFNYSWLGTEVELRRFYDKEIAMTGTYKDFEDYKKCKSIRDYYTYLTRANLDKMGMDSPEGWYVGSRK